MANDNVSAVLGMKGSSGGSVSSVNGKTGAVVLTAADLDDSFKDALLDCFANVAWATEDGQQYYDALESALYPIDHITADYTQSGTVYDTDSLESLKADLVVTAFYQGGGSKVVTTYTLSGTLTEGTSTITVSYGGKTATFEVDVVLSRESILGEFSDGITVIKAAHLAEAPYYNVQCCTRLTIVARACAILPVENKGYIFTVTDATKYNLAAYDVQSLNQIPRTTPSPTYMDDYVYEGGDKSIAWKSSDSVSTPYVWLALKKMDGTAFTAEELANGAEAVFTYTEGT